MLVRREVNKRFLKARPNRHPKNLVPLKNCKIFFKQFSGINLADYQRSVNGGLLPFARPSPSLRSRDYQDIAYLAIAARIP